MISALIILASCCPILLLFSLVYFFYKKNRRLEFIIFLATLIHEALLITLPTILDVTDGYKYEKSLRFNVTPEELLKVIFTENIYVLAFCIPFVLFSQKKTFEKPSTDKLYNLFAAITSLGIIVYAIQIVNRPTISDIIDSYSQSGLSGASNPLVAIFNIVFEYTAVLCAAILSVRGKDEIYPRLYQAIGIIMLMLALALAVVTGVRGRIVWVSEFVFLVAVYKRQFKPMLYIAVLALIFIPINNVLVTQIRPITEEIAKEGGITNEALINIGQTLIKGYSEKNTDKESGSFIKSIQERAQGPRNSIMLMREYDNGNSPGLNLYNGAIFYFIPRSVFNRPVIGSFTSNYKDAAMFKVMDLNYPVTTILNMGPFLASAHAYWEGGYWGVIVIALCCATLWLLIFRFAYSKPSLFGLLVCLLFACSLLIDGLISVFTPLYSIIALFWKNFLPLYIVYYCYMKIKLKKIIIRPILNIN